MSEGSSKIERAQAYARLVAQNKPYTLRFDQVDTLLAVQFKLLTSCLKTQEMQNRLIVALHEQGIKIPTSFSDDASYLHKNTMEIFDELNTLIDSVVEEAP